MYIPIADSSKKPAVSIAVYRGDAGCEGCSEMIVKSLNKTKLNLSIKYIGEKEKLKLNKKNLQNFDLYIQSGGGQDISAAYDALGDEGAEAIRNFVSTGKNFLGLCMGAYLADKDWIGLINAPLNSEVGRPGSGITDEGDYTISIFWGNKYESAYYQDGPYLNNSAEASDFNPISYYRNGDVAMAAYTYGRGRVVLSGPHPEADETWLDSSKAGYYPAEVKMKRILDYFNLKNN